MSVLAHAPHVTHRRPHAVPRPGPLGRLLRRLFHNFLQWRQRQVDQDIAIHLGLTSGRLTDEIERRMTERIVNGRGFRN